jgi:hypothetical protein
MNVFKNIFFSLIYSVTTISEPAQYLCCVASEVERGENVQEMHLVW